MDNNLDNLKRLIESLKSISFWGRVFSWKQIKNQLADAVGDMQKLIGITNHLKDSIVKMESNTRSLARELEFTQRELNETKSHNKQLIKDEESRKNEHSKNLDSLVQIRNQIQQERAREVTDKNIKEIERIRQLKDTWSKHQENARNHIKTVCQRHTVEYLEKVPFRGEPDNTLKICDEYVILDAKSPGSDDISNFPAYLKDQAERAKKYARQENVKSDIFFVVPSNTLAYLTIFFYRHADYNVYIISADAVEPIVLNLKRIEEYEFAEQLNPEDRENICRILGRFAHLSKRRIQVDSFFAKQFIELAYKCEADLPKDIMESVIDFETTEKMNPPQEKRAKAIPIGELEKDNKKIIQEAGSRGILMADENLITTINALPLYKETEK